MEQKGKCCGDELIEKMETGKFKDIVEGDGISVREQTAYNIAIDRCIALVEEKRRELSEK